MSYSPESLLVTGGAGFIGANFVHYWLENNPGSRVVVLDALTYAGNRASLAEVEQNKNYLFVQGDIRDQSLVENLLRKEGINTVVHFAAESHVDRSIHGPDAFLDTNIMGTHSLLKAAQAVWLDESAPFRNNHRFHHVSTDEVYGTLEPSEPPFSEANQYLPNSPYAASKAASDHIVRSYHHTYGLQVTTSNCSNNYGPYQFPEKLIPLIIANILDGKPLPIYGDGLQIRDWLYVDDHNRGIEQIIKGGRVGETYNIGGNNEWANIDIVRLVCELMDERCSSLPVTPSSSLITHVKDRLGHDRRYAIDATKITSEMGYQPQETFETGIRKTVEWYLANESWWRSVTPSVRIVVHPVGWDFNNQ
ncbi:MAG: dTDP-glucose 4,6-dehydratase [Candidatus Sedimenticola sp. (ex Thyasira tokunagai)]